MLVSNKQLVFISKVYVLLGRAALADHQAELEALQVEADEAMTRIHQARYAQGEVAGQLAALQADIERKTEAAVQQQEQDVRTTAARQRAESAWAARVRALEEQSAALQTEVEGRRQAAVLHEQVQVFRCTALTCAEY